MRPIGYWLRAFPPSFNYLWQKFHQVIEIGVFNELKILRETSVGIFLGDPSGEEVLLPYKYIPEKYDLEDVIEVFVYLDHEERKVATNIIPKITLNEFALLKVTAVTPVGAFLDWGLEKELLVPFREQRQKMEEGRWYIVYLDLDVETGRLFATNKFERELSNDELEVEEGDEVELLIFHKTDLGYNAIINGMHKGLIYSNEVFQELRIGDEITGYIKSIREENKIDLSLQPLGYKNYNDKNTEIIYRALMDNNGTLQLTDKSTPEEIYVQFAMSKKAFKKALGALYKDRMITIENGEIKMTTSS